MNTSYARLLDSAPASEPPPIEAGFSGSVFRIDHDQAYQHNVVLRYQRPKNAEWIDFTWRYDSGLVVSGVPRVCNKPSGVSLS